MTQSSRLLVHAADRAADRALWAAHRLTDDRRHGPSAMDAAVRADDAVVLALTTRTTAELERLVRDAEERADEAAALLDEGLHTAC